MTGLQLAALLLSLALLVSPPPRRRLVANAPAGRRFVGRGRMGGSFTACVVAGAVVLLPTTTVLAGAVVGATAALRYRRRRRGRSGMAEGRSLEAGLEVLVGELRAGAHPVRAFDVAADETAGLVSVGLRTVASRARLGADVSVGLRAAAATSALPGHWERLAVCWQLATDHGLAVATLMRAAQCDIAERQRFSAKVVSGMAGARATAGILAGLPLLGVLLGQLIGASPLSFLMDGGVGGVLLVIGLLLVCCGLLWSDRITDRVVSA